MTATEGENPLENLFEEGSENENRMDPVLLALNDMHNNMLYSSLVQSIKSFNGAPADFQLWIQSIEKVKRLLGNSNTHTVRAALQSSEGYIAEFIQRFVDEHPEGLWETLKAELKTKFGLSLDPMSALLQLRSCRQDSFQPYQMFGEKLLTLLPQAFPDTDVNDPLVQRELVNAFTSGVMGSKVRDKLVRSFPKTLNEAIKMANDEQQILDRVDMYRKSYPSQKSHTQVVPQNHQFKYNYRNERQEEPMDCNSLQKNRYQNGRPVCNHCDKVGHMWRDCWARLGYRRKPPNPQPPPHEEHTYSKRNEGDNSTPKGNTNGQTLMHTCDCEGHSKSPTGLVSAPQMAVSDSCPGPMSAPHNLN